jgi:large subunit ribosomal protein L15
MRLNELRPRLGATKKRKRVGCGIGSGHGKTSTRGHTGAGQHSAPRKDARFEGGQMPFYRRIPKRGFTNYTRVSYEVVNVSDLVAAARDGAVNPDQLRVAGLVRRRMPVKVLGNGAVGIPLQISAHAVSASARDKIEKAGGKIEILKW